MNNKILKILVVFILILVIIYLMGQIDYFMDTFQLILSLVLIPLLMGGFLYYLVRPVVRFLTGVLHSKLFSVILSCLLILILVGLFIYSGGYMIQSQVRDLYSQFNNYYQSSQNGIRKLVNTSLLGEFNVEEKAISLLNNIFQSIENNILKFFSTLTNIGAILVVIPFVLFYFLRDDRKIYRSFVNLFSGERREQVRKVLLEIDETLQVYIGGRLIVALLLGILTYIAYLILGMPNALILSIIATITSFVPIIGPIVGVLPALMVAVTVDIMLVVKVLIVLIIVQQLEGNVIQPNIQGGRLNIHPLVVIFTVFISIILFGFLGALFAVPCYVVGRILIKNFIINSGQIS